MPPKQQSPIPQGGNVTPAKKKLPASSMSWGKRVFLFVTTLIPVVAFFYSQVPSFVMPDVLCSWTESIVSDSELDATKSLYAATARDALVATAAYNRTMHWGTYRPNVLMGIKNRAAHPLLFGIAWYDTIGRFDVKHHAVESERLMFRWELHDGQFFGVQRIVDYENRVEALVDFVKTPDGTGWDVRVTCRRSGSNAPLTFVVYFAHEGGADEFPLTLIDGSGAASMAGHGLLQSGSGDVVGVAGLVEPPLSSDAASSGAKIPFHATLSDSCQLMAANATAPWSQFAFSKPKDEAWNFDVRRTPGLTSLKTNNRRSANVVVFKKEFSSDFRIQVCLREQPPSIPSTVLHDSGASSEPSLPALSDCQLTRMMHFHKAAFDRKFDALFFNIKNITTPLATQSPGAHQVLPQSVQQRLRFLQQNSKALRHMATSALSNLIGSIGYWHGKSLVVPEDVDEASDKRGQFVTSASVQHRGGQVDSETAFSSSLFSGAPSRAKFPRGFLWDEGFQQLLMYRWNSDISKDVIAHWLMVASDPTTGWIPREQILGKESRSRVPREFAAQHPQHANPPSMVLAVQSLALSASKTAEDVAYLQRLLPKLTKWRDWFHQTQCGGSPACHSKPRAFPSTSIDTVNASTFHYRWRSRNGFHLLACGLDDYPRPVCFSDGRPSNAGGATVSIGGGKTMTTTHRHEKHVDLMSWMALMTETIQSIEEAVRTAAEAPTSTTTTRASTSDSVIPWEELLVQLHWDAERRRFSDVTGCPTPKDGVFKDVRGYSGHFSPYVGYVNLFPLLSLTINDKSRALAVLRLARDELNTPFGLASVSARSRVLLATHGQQHESYWAGPIWININYLFLRALKVKYIALLGQEAEEFYHVLRAELLENLLRQYMATDKLWENYHWETGKGLGTAPFTGWTALIVLILGEQY